MRGGAVWQLVGLITRRSQVQILPPLPKKYAGPLQGSGVFFSLARGQDSVLREKQVQPSGGDASRREFAARQHERSECSILPRYQSIFLLLIRSELQRVLPYALGVRRQLNTVGPGLEVLPVIEDNQRRQGEELAPLE